MKDLAALLGVLVAFVVLPVAAGVAVQNPILLNGLPYYWPASQGAASTALTDASGDGVLSWAAAEPPDIVAFSADGTCPPGWSTYTLAQGRVIVGLVAGGTAAATVGTALTNSENRPTGQHSHSVTDPGHTHTQNGHSHSVSDPGHVHSSTGQGGQFWVFDGVHDTARLGSPQDSHISGAGLSVAVSSGGNNAASTGIGAVNSSGGVTGTNAPYVQLPICRSGGS